MTSTAAKLISMVSRLRSSAPDSLVDADLLEAAAKDKEELTALLRRPRGSPWNAQRWVQVRQQVVERGRFEDMRLLVQSVHAASAEALERRGYQLDDGVSSMVRLSDHLSSPESARWLGRENVSPPEEPEGRGMGLKDPPLLIVDAAPLDIVSQLALFSDSTRRRVCLLVEVSDFERDGTIAVSSTRGSTAQAQQQAAVLRSDFPAFADAAAGGRLRGSACTVQDHLCARDDPYVVSCPSLTVFRGPREEGYPFLPEPFHLDAIVTAMPQARPTITMARAEDRVTEWYAAEADQTALLERLHLIGIAALQLDQGSSPDASVVLVLSALGCCHGGRHPRDAVANSLKHWRRRFAQK
eukprot:gnl/TRDRNA2_/TRDRNA2_167205_c0_seq2.p1 gnl/TRDRNA2_/TRDRNA2_167205_c0~~gnl/TRDRNA2_/TRDRNA2_167205_c0_seq2.p1  ORF type:complete len:355 (-),score=56.82 gnl/TRDRNA2_/TRDRNA2_167205_c0_seq2:25-1089(-)